MMDLGDELAMAGKPIIELVKDIAKEAVVIAALKVLGMAGDGAPPAQAEPAPIKIEVVVAAQKAAVDTAFVLAQPQGKQQPRAGKQLMRGMDKKRFPARPALQIAAQKHKAMPM